VRDCQGMVVEIGPGTGCITRAILDKIPLTTGMLAVELNPVLAARVGGINDPRLVVHCGNAEELPEILRLHQCQRVSAVISGLPFSTISNAQAGRVLTAIQQVLAPGGKLVTYQARDSIKRLIEASGKKPVLQLIQDRIEWCNIPPLRLRIWRRLPSATDQASLGEGGEGWREYQSGIACDLEAEHEGVG